jgi:hypothetical protein
MRKHTKDWYFAAASANDLWIGPIAAGKTGFFTLEDSEEKVGASKGSSRELWNENLPNINQEDNSFGCTDGTYMCVQYGLEKAGLQ